MMNLFLSYNGIYFIRTQLTIILFLINLIFLSCGTKPKENLPANLIFEEWTESDGYTFGGDGTEYTVTHGIKLSVSGTDTNLNIRSGSNGLIECAATCAKTQLCKGFMQPQSDLSQCTLFVDGALLGLQPADFVSNPDWSYAIYTGYKYPSYKVTVVSEGGWAKEYTPSNHDSLFYVNDEPIVPTEFARGFILLWIDRKTGQKVGSGKYDEYGSGSSALSSLRQAVDNLPTDVVVMLSVWDTGTRSSPLCPTNADCISALTQLGYNPSGLGYRYSLAILSYTSGPCGTPTSVPWHKEHGWIYNWQQCTNTVCIRIYTHN